MVCSYYGIAKADSPQYHFKPHAAFSQYAGSSCSNAKAFFISGNAQTNAQLFQNPSLVFGGSIRSNADIKVTGNGYVNGDATPAPGKQVILNGNGTVTGSTEAAAELLNCSIEDLNGLVEWVEQNHQNDQIPQTDKGRLPWSCDNNPLPNDPWQFCLQPNETIHLPAGIYWFSEWKQGIASKVIIDGYVRILVTGEIAIENHATVNNNGNPYDLLIFNVAEYTDYELLVDDEVSINALLYAPAVNAHLSGQSKLNGGIIFSELKLSGQAQLIRWIDEAVAEISFIQPAVKCSSIPEFSIEVEVTDEESGIDPESVYLFVNDSAIDYSVEPFDSSWHTIKITAYCDSVSCGITDGVIQIRADVQDRAGNYSQAYHSIIIDATPPIIGITYPANEDVIKEPSVIVIGNVWDEFSSECGLSVSVNSVPLEIMTDGSWFTTIALHDGDNPVEAIAIDGVGNSDSHEIVIRYSSIISPIVFGMVPQYLIVDEHQASEGTSNLNGIFEPGETVVVEPVWKNTNDFDVTVSGLAINWRGPADARYEIKDAHSDYGIIEAGTTTSCWGKPQGCFELKIINQQVPHRDAWFDEVMSTGGTHTCIVRMYIIFGRERFYQGARERPNQNIVLIHRQHEIKWLLFQLMDLALICISHSHGIHPH